MAAWEARAARETWAARDAAARTAVERDVRAAADAAADAAARAERDRQLALVIAALEEEEENGEESA